MAHSHRFAGYLVSLFLGLSAFTGRHRGDGTDALSPERQQLLRVALSHVGICEATGHNDGAEVERFQRSTGNHRGDEWCSSHCAACFVEAHLPLPRQVNGAARSWFDTPHLIYLEGQWLRPGVVRRPGDQVGYVYRGSPLIHHVGFQQSEWGSTSMVYTLEGNYGSGVRIVLRAKRSIHAIAKHLP